LQNAGKTQELPFDLTSGKTQELDKRDSKESYQEIKALAKFSPKSL
jgi:hypothetical protein